MTEKYELLTEPNNNLLRLRALKSFGNIKEGQLGGLVGSGKNLSQKGTCWVYPGASVYMGAKVYGQALVYGNAQVRGDVIVRERAHIFEDATVFGDAVISGHAKVSEHASVYGDAIVSGYATVRGSAIVCGFAEVGGSSLVFENARVNGNSKVSGTAQVRGNSEITTGEVERTALNIAGHQWNITITKNHLQIGCQCHTFEEWKNFSDRKINEMHFLALNWWKQNCLWLFDVINSFRNHENV